MSDVTDKIRAFNQGKITREELVEYLSTRNYTNPASAQNRPADSWDAMAHRDESPYYTDGSWHEVERAHYGGTGEDRIDRELYMEILKKAHEAHKPAE